ncbi:MAG TPA: hypothetical protein VFC60_01590 [Tissierellaceae bacterium]|nr:hypothetical protein [Tissierellaceae bacterium]
MESKYSEIIKHIPSLEDHGHLYLYYGTPYSEECDVYEDQDEAGNNLIESYECYDLCTAIADEFEYEYEFFDILDENKIMFEEIFDVDVEKQDFEVTISLLLYLVASIAYEDKFIDALNNGYLVRLLKRLEQLSR